MRSCGKPDCYVCWDGDCLSESAYLALRRVEQVLTDALNRTPIDWGRIRRVEAAEYFGATLREELGR